MVKISKSQKKIIIISFIIVLAFLIFWFFIYLPNKNRAARVKSELSNVKSQIQEVEMIVGRAKTIEEGITKTRARHEKLNNLFPQKEESALKELSNLAQKLNIEVISITPQPKKVFLDSSSRSVEAEGKVCQFVPVSIRMKCLYKDLVKYIETLRESLPAFTSIESLKISNDRTEQSRLNVLLQLNLYLLS